MSILSRSIIAASLLGNILCPLLRSRHPSAMPQDLRPWSNPQRPDQCNSTVAA